MIDLLVLIGGLGLAVQAIIGLAFLVSCICEKERRASFFASVQFAAMAALPILYMPVALSGFFHTTFGNVILLLGYAIFAVAAYFLAAKIGGNARALLGTDGLVTAEVNRVDESSHVFSRNRSLRPGTAPYRTFYAKHPELEEGDAKRRGSGGPLGHLGLIDRPGEGPNCAATAASLAIPQLLGNPESTHPKASPFMQNYSIGPMSPDEATERVKGFARNIGADLVGIAKINPNWIYSHRGEIHLGNWEDWGNEIPADHSYAVVVAEEMEFDMVGSAPHTPSVVESMKNYARGAFLSTQIAAFIANLGYEATANHLRHYTAILPPLAVDAGLGEVGRLGYLMTREFGPRIRLSAVTTNLHLVPDKPIDIGVEDFCRICRKCSTCCPSKSIPEDDKPQPFNGTLRWKTNAETCFEYWGKLGTDCCICMKVCPWSHSRTWPHRIIVWLISRNAYSRRLFNALDDIFYAKRPKAKKPPSWARYN